MDQRKSLGGADSGVDNFRRAVDRLTQVGEYRSWVAVHAELAIHGSAEYFLAWHRAYLFFFEKRLQELVPGTTIPYWDWTRLHAVPPPFLGAGNPLDHPRNPGGIVSTLPGVGEIEGASGLLRLTDYTRFANRLEFGPHGRVHNWVGRDMANIRVSPSDPLFWCHHAYVDLIWDRWQRAHAGGPANSGFVLDVGGGRTKTVGEVLHTAGLGYEYVSTTLRFAPAAAGPNPGAPIVFKPESAVRLSDTAAGDEPRVTFGAAEVRFAGLAWPTEGPYEARVFLGPAGTAPQTPAEGDPNYLGYFDLPASGGGHGGRHGPHGGVDYSLDATGPLKRMLAAGAVRGDLSDLSLTLVFEGHAEEFRCEQVSVVLSD